MGSVQYFDHTADIGLEIEAASFEELIELACSGTTAVLIADPQTIGRYEQRSIVVHGDDPSALLVDVLTDLLFQFEVEGLVFGEFHASTAPGALNVVAVGEGFDAQKHPVGAEVKAVTYHDLRVEQKDGAWRARFVLDI